MGEENCLQMRSIIVVSGAHRCSPPRPTNLLIRTSTPCLPPMSNTPDVVHDENSHVNNKDNDDEAEEEEEEEEEEVVGHNGRSWTTAEQWAWLMKTRAPYLAAQKARAPGKYLATMYREFLAEFSECKLLFGHTNEDALSPEERAQLAEAVKKRKKVCHGTKTYCLKWDTDTSIQPSAAAIMAQEPRLQAEVDEKVIGVAGGSRGHQESRLIATGT